jgi:hypothetical protein
MAVVVLVDDGVSTTARDQVTVDRESGDVGHREGERQAAPEEDVREPGLHRSRDDEQDRVVDDLR